MRWIVSRVVALRRRRGPSAAASSVMPDDRRSSGCGSRGFMVGENSLFFLLAASAVARAACSPRPRARVERQRGAARRAAARSRPRPDQEHAVQRDQRPTNVRPRPRRRRRALPARRSPRSRWPGATLRARYGKRARPDPALVFAIVVPLSFRQGGRGLVGSIIGLARGRTRDEPRSPATKKFGADPGRDSVSFRARAAAGQPGPAGSSGGARAAWRELARTRGRSASRAGPRPSRFVGGSSAWSATRVITSEESPQGWKRRNGRQVRVQVEGQAVPGHPAPHRHADRAHLAFADPHAREAWPARRA